jgi:hypothetical protein
MVHAYEERLLDLLRDDSLGGKLCAELGAQGLACVAASSNSFLELVYAVVQRDRAGLLDSAIAIAQQSREQQHKQAVCWLAALLLRKAPDSAADVVERLLKLPNVPKSVAEQLVSAGVRVSYAQLLAAANSMVAGVEVWVQAQQQLGIQTDIPAAAVAICCGGEWVSGASAVATAL